MSAKTVMWGYRLRGTGADRRLTLVQEAVPQPGPGQILVRIEAASLNYRDLMVADGRANGADGLIPLSDGAGVVQAVGAGVERWRVGDRVASLFFQDWQDGPYASRYGQSALGGNTQHGVLAEFVVLAERGVIGVGDGAIAGRLTAVQAATLPCAALTAWQAMFERTLVTADDTVLVQGTGGVALFGLQFGHAVGARTIVLSSSTAKLERARQLGASDTINYREVPDWDRAVRDLTGGLGASFIIENGGPGTFDRSLAALAAGGRIAQIGVLTGFGPQSNLMRLQNLNADILGITVGSAEHFRALLAFVARHGLVPVIDREFPLDQAPQAYDYLRSGQHFGKVVIRL